MRTSDELEARWQADVLRDAGVEAQVMSQKDRANVVTFGGLSVVRLLVPAFRLEEALVRLDRLRAEREGDRP